MAAVTVGEQPEEDGLLACLECGSWYRGLGAHVAGAHGISADEYRLRHELPRSRGLWAEDARRAAGRRAQERQRSGRYPKALKTRLTGDRDQIERSVAAQRESSQRAGTQKLLKENRARMAEETRRRTRAKYDGLADALGYAGVDDLLEKHADSTSAELADLLDVSVSGAKWLRRYHAAGFHLDHRPSAPARLSHEELARLEPGDQPVSETHVLCLACGSWFRGLPRHVTARHGLSMDDYRIRFSLAAEVPLVPANVGEANRRAQMERRLRRAQEHGYEDFEDMVARTRDWPAPKVADMMDVVPETVAIWRRRGTSQS